MPNSGALRRIPDHSSARRRLERLAREKRGRAGILLDVATWEELLAAGEAMGLAPAQAIAGPVAD